jgi:hypothetical protein
MLPSPKSHRRPVNRAAFEFLITDLEVAMTLAQIAANSGNDAEKRARNLGHARRAYDTVREFSRRTRLTASQSTELENKIAGVKSELEKLGEVF